MKLEQQVVSLELAKQLKEAGYKQEGLWWWCEGNTYTDYEVICGTYGVISKERLEETTMSCYRQDPKRDLKYYVAPTVAELGEYLTRDNFTNLKTSTITANMWFECLHHTLEKPIIANTEADARAKMWLYLKKEGLL